MAFVADAPSPGPALAPANDGLPDLTATELSQLYEARDLSPVEVTRAVLERIAQVEPAVNAFALLDGESALADARASESRWAAGAPLSPFDGVPAAVKDLLWAKGWPTRRGSRAIDPSDRIWDEDAPAVARLREAGAVLLGKTTTSEFGYKGLTDSPVAGITRNPWDLSRTPGGSSGGAAVAAALGLGPFQVATDGGGSTRQPAGFSGVFGLKPTFGRVPGYPSAHTGTLFHVAPLTRTVGDAAALLSIIAQPDARDWHALPHQPIDWQALPHQGVAGLRIAFSPALGYAQVHGEIAAAVKAAVEVLEAHGAIVSLADPGFEDPYPLQRTLWTAAAARLLANLPEERRPLVELGLQEAARQGHELDAVTYLGAVEAREALGCKLALFHQDYDLLVTPTTSQPAPRVDGSSDDGAKALPSPFTYPFNLTQQPAASVPVGLTTQGLPIGLQIVAAKYREDLVLRAAGVLEQALPFVRAPLPA